MNDRDIIDDLREKLALTSGGLAAGSWVAGTFAILAAPFFLPASVVLFVGAFMLWRASKWAYPK